MKIDIDKVILKDYGLKIGDKINIDGCDNNPYTLKRDYWSHLILKDKYGYSYSTNQLIENEWDVLCEEKANNEEIKSLRKKSLSIDETIEILSKMDYRNDNEYKAIHQAILCLMGFRNQKEIIDILRNTAYISNDEISFYISKGDEEFYRFRVLLD